MAVSKNPWKASAGGNTGYYGNWSGCQIDFCGHGLPKKLKSLRLEGVRFTMPQHPVERRRFFQAFLEEQDGYDVKADVNVA